MIPNESPRSSAGDQELAGNEITNQKQIKKNEINSASLNTKSSTGTGLIRDTFAFGLQSVLPQVLSLILLPVFTSVLTPDDYAAVDLANVFALCLAGIVHLQIPSIIGRFYFDCEPAEVPSFYSTIFLSAAACVGLVLGIVMYFGDAMVGFVFPKSDLPFYPLFFLALITVGISSLASLSSYLLQVQKKATTLLRISIAVALVHFPTSVIMVVVLRWGPVGVLAAAVVSSLFNLILLTWINRKSLTYNVQTKYLPPGLRYSLPLIPHFYGGFLFVSSDKIVLEKFVSLADLGLYAVAVRLSSPLSIFVEAFNNSISPRFFESSKKSKPDTVEEFREIITKWLATAGILWIGFCLFADEAVKLLTPTSYHGATIFLSILSASYVFRGLYCFAVNPLFFEKRTIWVPWITVISGVANVVLNIALIPYFGIIAAAWTTLVSFVMTFVLAFLIGGYIYPLKWNIRSLSLIGVIAVSVVMLASLFTWDSFVSRNLAKGAIYLMAIVLLGFVGELFSMSAFMRIVSNFYTLRSVSRPTDGSHD